MELPQLAERVAQPGGAAAFVRAAALQLVSWPSVTGTSAEAEFGERLQMLISSLPYFRAHPEAVWLEPVPHDSLGRSNAFALVQGRAAFGVVLTGHYDVVSTEPYGDLEHLAFRPEDLRSALVEDLRDSARSPADELALEDLADGAFLPGRGMLDMKSGLAAGLAVLLRCAQAGEGTVLLIASPDEEALSAGARAAVSGLGHVAERTGVQFVAAVNLDSEVDSGDGSRGRAVFLGSVGKLLPAALFVGRPAHAGAPFAGVNAAYLGAALAADLELSPIWSAHDEGIAPPVCLSLRDLKPGYDVTLPSMSFAAFNVMFHRRAPAEVFQAFVEQVAIVLRRALRTLADRAHAAGVEVSWPEPALLTLAELPGGGEHGPPTSSDPLLGSLEAAASAIRRAGVEGPAAVALLAGPYYPPVALGDDLRSVRLREIAGIHARRLGVERGEPISLRDCFPGISDMSFLGSGRAGAAQEEVVNANTPDAGRFSWDSSLAARLGVPVVNIGPWGRDYHQRLERVHTTYSFVTLPELIYSVVRDLLKEG